MQHSKDLSKPQSRESDGNYLIILLKIEFKFSLHNFISKYLDYEKKIAGNRVQKNISSSEKICKKKFKVKYE